MKEAARTIGSWITAGLILLATINFASAGHKYMPEYPPPIAVAEAPCVLPVDLLKRVRELYPRGTFGIQPLFRAGEAQMFAKLVGQEGAHTFYVLVNQRDKRWIIFPGNKKNCVLLLDGANATEEKFSQIRGQGLAALKDITDFVKTLKENKVQEKRRESTV